MVVDVTTPLSCSTHDAHLLMSQSLSQNGYGQMIQIYVAGVEELIEMK